MRQDDPATAATTSTVTGVCHHDCPDSCVWEVTVDHRNGGEGPRAVALRGRRSHPFTRGELCPRVNPFLERVYHPDRVLQPLARVGAKGDGRFVRISWDQALERIAGAVGGVIADEGPGAVLPYGYAGNQGLLQCAAMSERLFNRMGAARLDGGLCGNTADAGVAATLGSGIGIDPEDLRHARAILLWSTNTLVTNRHLWPFVEEARSHGATVVCIDPLRTRTADHADWHVQLLPGTDAALALGMMHVLIDHDLVDRDYVRDHTSGFDELAGRVATWTPERTAQICGLAAADVVRLAVLYGSTRPAAIRVLIGMEHRVHGAMAYRNLACLPALTGAWRDLGGGLVRSTGPLFDDVLATEVLYRPDLRAGRRRGVEMGRLGQALAEPAGPEHVAAMFVFNCNPAAITPDQTAVLRGLRRDDLFTVVIDQFVTDTARHADVVLPATTQIEHLDLMAPWGHSYLSLNLPAIAPRGEASANTEIFRRIGAALGYTDPALADTDEAMIRDLLAASEHPFLRGITYDRLVAEGSVRLALPADWRPYAAGGFATASRRADLVSESMAARGLDALPSWVPATESLHGDAELLRRFPLACITVKRHQRFLNSSHSMLDRHTAAEGEPIGQIHPVDAAARGLTDGDLVRMWNDRGSIVVRAEVTDRVRRDVVTISFGWPLARSGGVGCNVVTNAASSDQGGGTAFHDTLVQAERWGSPTAAAAAGITAAWSAAVGDEQRGSLHDLVLRHGEPGRRYHTAEHVLWVLRHVADLIAAEDEARVGGLDTGVVLAAALFHDAVYDPRAGTNEADSAALAVARLSAAGWDATRSDHVAEVILSTATHVATSAEAAIVLDADLAVLGAPAADYATYVADVRAEFAHVSDEGWRVGRSAVLRQFLQRDRIYATPTMVAMRESAARRNLAAELAELAELAAMPPAS